MRTYVPEYIAESSSAQQDSTSGANMIYTGFKLLIPADGWWDVRGFASMTSTNVPDTKNLGLALNGVFLPGSPDGAGEVGTVNAYLPFECSYSGYFVKGSVFQLWAMQNGASIIRVGSSATPGITKQRISARRVS